MSLLALSLAYIRARALNAALNLVLLALGVGTIVLLLLFSAQLEDRLTRDARGFDLVIGAKGSPLQLILSSIYQVDFPTGNIPLAEAERWAEHPLVAEAIPLALGDSFAGFRIVGTEHGYVEHYGAALAAGRLWQAPFEATLGAQRRGRDRPRRRRPIRRQPRPRSRAAPQHGEHPYTVVGVLEPTASVLDRLVLTPIESVWLVHGMEPHEHHDEAAGDEHATRTPTTHEEHAGEHGDEPAPGAAGRDAERPLEITALLLRYNSPLAAVQLPLPGQSGERAAGGVARVRDGAAVVTGRGRRRHAARLRPAADRDRRAQRVHRALERDAGAALRSRGDAHARRVARGSCSLQPLLEGLLLAGAGALLGIALGHGVAEAVGQFLPRRARTWG